METLKIIGQVLVVVAIVGGAVVTMTHHWQNKYTPANLAKALYWFGLICGALGIFAQYGSAYQVGTQEVFGDANFFIYLGILSVLGGIYLNTEKK